MDFVLDRPTFWMCKVDPMKKASTPTRKMIMRNANRDLVRNQLEYSRTESEGQEEIKAQKNVKHRLFRCHVSHNRVNTLREIIQR